MEVFSMMVNTTGAGLQAAENTAVTRESAWEASATTVINNRAVGHTQTRSHTHTHTPSHNNAT